MVMELQSSNSKTLNAPAFMVKPLSPKCTEKVCNMDVQYKQMIMTLGKKTKKKADEKKSKKKADEKEVEDDYSETYKVDIPVLVNTKEIKINDELCLAPEKAGRKRQEPPELIVQPCSKVKKAKLTS